MYTKLKIPIVFKYLWMYKQTKHLLGHEKSKFQIVETESITVYNLRSLCTIEKSKF